MLGGLPAGRRPPPTSTHRGGTRDKARLKGRAALKPGEHE
jgi:hypothetical protein